MDLHARAAQHLQATLNAWRRGPATDAKERPWNWSTFTCCLQCAATAAFAPSLIQHDRSAHGGAVTAYRLAADALLRYQDSSRDYLARRRHHHQHAGLLAATRQRAEVTHRAFIVMLRRLLWALHRASGVPAEHTHAVMAAGRQHTLQSWPLFAAASASPIPPPPPKTESEAEAEAEATPNDVSNTAPMSAAAAKKSVVLSHRAREVAAAASSCIAVMTESPDGASDDALHRRRLMRALLPTIVLYERIAELAMPHKTRPCGVCERCIQGTGCVHSWKALTVGSSDSALLDACFGPVGRPASSSSPGSGGHGDGDGLLTKEGVELPDGEEQGPVQS
jgi:hypothetical protein